jgi:hypothetical protein
MRTSDAVGVMSDEWYEGKIFFQQELEFYPTAEAVNIKLQN